MASADEATLAGSRNRKLSAKYLTGEIMVAIVSGNSLGLSLTSSATGQNLLTGSAALGRQGQNVYVNSANGNLVLQHNDDYLSSTGIDVFAVRTYNSQGTFDGDGNDDNWRLGFFRSLDSLTGTLNTNGSAIIRTDADGARTIYRYNSSSAAYINTEGSGAHDTLTYDAVNRQWSWTDGSSRTVETYAWADGAGKLVKQTDASGNRIDFVYTGNQLTEVRDQSGEKQLLVYVGANLAEIRNVRQDGSTLTRVRYGYDDLNRLTTVTVDLTPEDNSIADGKAYVTTYSYDGDSKRLAGVAETDGTRAQFTYNQIGTSWLVDTLTQVVDGVARTTRFTYAAIPNAVPASVAETRITDALGNLTIVTTDSNGRLTKIAGPQVNGISQSVSYTYDSAGNVLSQTDAMGNTSRFQYDNAGNQVSSADRLGNLVTRTFNGNNQMVSETVRLHTANANYSFYGTTYFVYDSRSRLRFTVTDGDSVTEYRYDAAGNRSSVIKYPGAAYTSSNFGETDLANWVNGIADKSMIQRSDYAYDFRGQVSSITAWAKVDTMGTGVSDGNQSVTTMVYDQAGQLLQTIAPNGLITNTTYDGLGRVLATTDNTGASTTAVYDDVGNRVLTTQTNGLVTTSVYDESGELKFVVRSDSHGVLGETRYWYDTMGRLRVKQDPDGGKHAYLYDAAGRMTGEIDVLGRLTEYKYNANGDRTESIAYATLVAPVFMARVLDFAQAAAADALDQALHATLDSVRPAVSATDTKTWNLYDADDRLTWQIDALGYATQTLYDGESRAYATNRLATPIDVSLLKDGTDVVLKLQGNATSVQLSEAPASGTGGAHTYTAVVSPTGTGAVGGTVSFFAGGVLLGSAAVVNNVATFTAPSLPAGHSDITGVYSGDATNTCSTSNVLDAFLSDAVNGTAPGAPVTVTLGTPAGPVRQGAAVTYTATVGGNQPAGIVTFVSGKTVLGTASVASGVATLTLASNAFDAGTATIVASYAGDAANAPAISQGVQQAVTAGVRQVVIGASAADRKVWNYVDADGRLRISVDAENYATQYFYDSANRLVKTVVYAQPLWSTTAAASYERNGVGDRYDYISSYLPSPNAADRITYSYFDNLGRKVGEVDAEGYLSEYVYDNASRVIDTIRYASPARPPVSTASTLASLRPVANTEDHHTRNEYDLHDRLKRQTAADGTVTEYTYDIDGHVTSTIRARGTADVRASLKRYDALGRLAAQLDSIGAALIVDGMSAAAVDAVWAEHGTRYSYDIAGRLTSTSAPQGQRSVYFYDDEGQLRFSVNALGEVVENEYDTLGRQIATTRYATRVDGAAVNAMAGGLLSDDVNAAALMMLAAARAAHAAQNSVAQTRYDSVGHAVGRADALGHVSSATYNAFGEVVASTQPGTIGGSVVTTVHNYDRRGLETSTVQRTDKVYVTRSAQYDAFGRMVRSTDANGNTTQTAFDRLGRMVQTTDAAGGRQGVIYDAFDRQLTTTDALNNVTRYVYDTSARSIMVTTAENVVTTTLVTRNGQVLSVKDGNANTTSYHYDGNGNLLDVVTAAGSVVNGYDAANRLVLTRDRNGTEVAYTYDAANRQLTRTVDAQGLNLRTRYDYDAKGQAVRVTDPSGVVTTTEYDLDGAKVSQTYDADGARLTTVYTNDARGQVVRVQAPGGALTDYVYDDLGRRIRTIIDPAGLALTESYEYDKNGNVVAKTDPNGNRTRYVYDTANRPVYTVDPLGYVKQNTYDAQGRVTRTTVYAKAVNQATLAANPTIANVGNALMANSTQDTVDYRVYDKDGRLAYDVDGLGGVTAYKYDGNGNVVSRLTYANRINMSGWTVGTAPAPQADAARDVLVRTVYDAMNRPVYTIDGTGGVTAMGYDAAGNLLESVRYAHAIVTATPATASAVAAAVLTDAGADVHVRYRYDSAGRKTWEADSLGQVIGYTYDDAGNMTKKVAYAQKIGAQAEPSSVTAGSGDRVTLMGYDVQHRMTVQIDQDGVVTRRAFDGNGNVVSVVAHAQRVSAPTATDTIALANQVSASAALDHTVRSVYDAANREIYRIDSLGIVTEQQYDANGNVVARIDYAKPIATTTVATLAAVAAAVSAVADNAHDVRTHNVYDADGLLIWSVQNGRDLTNYTYNDLGELQRKILYAKALTAEQTDFSPAALASAALAAANAAQDGLAVKVYDKGGQLIWNIDGAGTVSNLTYDTGGNVIAQVVYAQKLGNPASLANGSAPAMTSSPYDVRSYKVYDQANRLAWTIDGTGGVTHYTYDGKGQLVETRAYATRINLGTWTVGTVPAVVADATDAVNRTVYDADGRAMFTIDGTGHVVEMKYDRDGNVSERVRYVNPVPLATAATRVALTAALGAGDAGDLHERYAYDAAGRVLFRADAAGHVTGYTYDAYGNVTKQVSYAATVGASVPVSSVQPSSRDQVVLTAYDADNRAVMQIDASGKIVRKTFDSLGNVTKTTAYANRVARPTAASASLGAAAMAALIVPDDARDRMSLSVFDADQHEIYSVDANGAVTARQFDALGHLTSRTVYFARIAVSAAADAPSMASLVASIADPARDDQMRYVVDQAGRVLYSVDAAGDVISYAYTSTGQVMSTRTYLRKATAITPVSVAGLSALVSGATPNARVDYVYDAADRLAYEVDTAGGVTGHEYDGEGNEIKRTAYATRINRAQFTPGTAPAVAADALRDSSVRTVYDGLGRPSFTIDRDGYVVALKYDVAGHVAERVAYGRRIDPQTPATAAAISAAVQLVADATLDMRDVSVYGADGRLAWSMTKTGQVTAYTYDARGNLVKQVAYANPVQNGAAPQSVAASAGDKVTLAAYDGDNRPVVSVDATGRVTKLVYDMDGNVLQRITFANLVDAPTAQSAPVDVNALPASDAANDRIVRNVYDNAGREIYSIDQSGAVTATRYDGMVVEHTAYAKAVPADTVATAAALAAAAQGIADATRDRFTRSVLDASGKLMSITDARGNITRYSYDAAGNRIETVTPEGKTVRQVFDTQGRVLATVNEMGAATGFAYDVYGNVVRRIQYSATVGTTYDPSALSAAPAANDRVNLMAYDQNGRLIYAIDGEGTVRQQQFDAAGNMTALTIYATKVTTATVAAGAYGVAGIAAQVTVAATDDRTSHQVFDAANRLVYSVDSLGFTQKLEYDDKGNLTAQTRFAKSVFMDGPFGTWTMSGLAGRVTADPDHDRTERFEYNVAGQVTRHTDAEGKVEITAYDSLGRKQSFTDKNQHTWVYEYDAGGNLAKETSPEVEGKDGATVRRVVAMEYDALGQLLKRSETGDGQTVVTAFAYDSLGNQVSIDYGKLTGYVPGTTTATQGTDAVVTMAYDRHGKLITQTDVAGYVSRKVYDEIGQLRYEIDAKGNVTEHQYNSTGEQVSLSRYDGAITLVNPTPTVADIAALVATLDQTKRRTITTTYDMDGRALQVTQPSGYTDDSSPKGSYRTETAGAQVRYVYDAFGAVIQTSRLLNVHDNAWLIDNNYYDQRGLLQASVDAAGYKTTYGYDSTGNVTTKREYATAIAAWTGNRLAAATTADDANDRITATAYDKNGRVVRESLTDGSGRANNEHVRVNEYDGAGNVTLTKAWGPGATDSDAPTRMFYDALGRMTAVIDGTHKIDAGYGLTTYRYNLAGKVVQQAQYAHGSVSGTDPTPAAASADDRATTTEYDEQGNAIHVVDPEGLSQYFVYDKRGLQTDTWSIGQGLSYTKDVAFGRFTRTYDEVGRLLTDSYKSVSQQYNAFGEMTRKQQGTDVTYYEYDTAGRMWRTNENGRDEIYVYDLLGRRTSLLASDGAEFSNRDIKSYTSVVDANAIRFSLQLVEYKYDLAGNVISEMAPLRASYRPVTTFAYDRWHNMLRKTEPAATISTVAPGPTTSYTYDMQNRVTSESDPKADGTAGGRVRTFEYTFGAQGAMVGRKTIDRESAAVTGEADNNANHARYRVTTETFTAAGKLLSADTNGIVIEKHTYDAFNQVLTDEVTPDRAVRYTYNHAGQVTSVTHASVDIYNVTQSGSVMSATRSDTRALTECFAYDELGYLTSVTNGAGEVTTYRHDIYGNVVWVKTPASAATSATWDASGRKLTATDALGHQAMWDYDSYGRLNTLTGYDGSVTTYTYDNRSQLRTASEPSKGQTVTYTYDGAGHVVYIIDNNNGSFGYLSMNKWTSYTYDLAGNRLTEITRLADGTFADNAYTYDALHRVVKVLSYSMGDGSQNIAYEYDGFGNRSRYTSTASDKGPDRNQDGYFFYDALNRVTISGALDASGTFGGATEHRTYDEAGNLQTAGTAGHMESYAYDAMNRLVSTSENGQLVFRTAYDAAGRVVLTGEKSAKTPAITSGVAAPVEPVAPVAPTPPSSGATQAQIDAYNAKKAQYDKDKLAYDAALAQYQSDLQDYNDQNAYLDGVRAATVASEYERHIRAYDAQGRLVVDQGLKDDGSLKTMMVNDAFDAAGNVLAYHTDAMVNDHIRSDYAITYRTLTNGVVQASSTGHMTVLSGQLSGKTGSDATSTNVYDANGYLIGVDYTTAGDAPNSGTSKKIFILDAHGNILLSREESWNSPTVVQRQILIGDELELRYSINFGTFGNLQDEQKNAFWDAYNADAYQNLVTPGGTVTAGAGDNPTTGQAIVVAEGDTLQSIAQRVYGTADAWYRIADANNLEHDSVLVAGTTLVAPSATADTNKLDFNMGKLVGSTAPNLPPPQAGRNNCLTLIIVAVAVVVGCVVAPYMTGFVAGMGLTGTAATVVAGGLTAAATNVASQAVGIVGGVQDGMNWSGVARSAVGGALNAGLNAVVGDGAGLTSSSFVNAGVSNIASQAVMIATHRQEKFSWASVAGAAVSGAVVKSDAMGDMQTSMADNGWSGWARGAVNGGLGAVLGGAATKFSWASVAGAAVAGGVANSDTMMGIGESMANAGWSPFAQGAVLSGVSGFAGNLTRDLVAHGKQDWAQIGIATFEGALSTGLEVQRQFNLAHGTPFLFDDALSAAGRRAGQVVGDVLGNSLAYQGSSPADDGAPSPTPESKSVSPQVLGTTLNGGLIGSQLFGGDADWLKAIGPYNGRLANDQSGTTFAGDRALRAAENSFPFTAPIPQVVVNANLTPEQRVASKFGINSYSWAEPQQTGASPFEFRSFFGDAYRNAAREATSSENSWGVRVGYAASAVVLALPGLANDAAREFLNGPGRIYRGAGTMSAGIRAGDPYQFSSGLMNTSVGLLGLAGGASVIRSAVLANARVGSYANARPVLSQSDEAPLFAPSSSGFINPRYQIGAVGDIRNVGPRISQEGPVTFRAPPGATAEEIAQVKAYVDESNAALEAGYLSPTGRVSTKGTLRTDASLDAALERARAAEAGTPYVGHAGHVPDTTWTGKASPYSWLDLSPRVNTSLGGQARGYPVGYKPTEFIFEE
jgi:YD repeat-containing protein